MNYNKVLLNKSIEFLNNKKKQMFDDNKSAENNLMNENFDFKKNNNNIRKFCVNFIISEIKNKKSSNIIKDEKYIQLLNEKKHIIDKYNINICKKIYLCDLCNDKFFIENKICNCLKKIYISEQKKLLLKNSETKEILFENFDFFYYKSTKGDNIISPLENITYNYKQCKFFCENFDYKKKNIFLFGNTGLGKTFLSLCIANFLIEQCFFVYYDTSINICRNFENKKFNNNNFFNIDDYYNCDLLIIDNFGTELITNFTISSIYELIDYRINNKKSTIINTNLVIDDISNKYSQTIYSRINGKFLHLRFFGNDIRKQIKMKKY